MGIRETQLIGLSLRARALVELGDVHSHIEQVTRTYPDGRRETETRRVSVPAVRVRESGEEVEGMFGERYPLMAYELPDGTVLTEAVQHEAWSSGPVIHLALRTEAGTLVPESLWPAHELAAA